MRALVTGGGGFLGAAIVRRLLTRGAAVRSLARGRYPELEDLGVETRQGDVADAEDVSRAVADNDVVFHVAARVGGWGPRAEFWRTNVVGTENVIAACRRHGVPKLVYTSTPSVVHAGGDVAGADESLPYAEHFEAAYPETKAEAERRVLSANDAALATLALRPHLVWGPGDNQLIPRLLARARAGRVRLIGREDKLVDATYIDNAAEAHLRAADRLAPGAACAGRAYFIAQGEPRPASEHINSVLEAAGLPPVTKRLPTNLAWCAGALAEALFWLLRREEEPPLTRFAVRQLSTAHWYDLGAARRDLGYAPEISTRQGLALLRESFEKQAAAGAAVAANPHAVTPSAPRMDFLSRRIHLVTGKGGVGRTTVAAALAVAAAEHGKRVLLTEIGDPEGGFSAIGRKFGREQLTPDPQPLGPPGLRGCHVWATRGHELFARSVIPAGPLIRAALRSRALRKFVSAVPSLYELGVFFHLLRLLQATRDDGRPEHEVIVADMPATGQTLALTSLPQILLDALPDGPIPRYMREGQAYLSDPTKGVAWIVTLPELLPVTEAVELIEGLRGTHVTPAGVILNRMPADPFDPEERQALSALLKEQPMHGALTFHQIGAARDAEEQLRAEADVPIFELPELAERAPNAVPHELCRRLGALMEPT